MAKKTCYVDRYTGKGKTVSSVFGIPFKTLIEDNEIFGDWIERNFATDQKPDWQFSHTEPIRVSSNMQEPGPNFYRALLICYNIARNKEQREQAAAVYQEIIGCPADKIQGLYAELCQRFPKEKP